MKLEEKVREFLPDLHATRTTEEIEYEGNWAAGDAPSDPIEHVTLVEVPDYGKRITALKNIIKTTYSHFFRKMNY